MIFAADTTIETRILAALGALPPRGAAWWDGAPAGTVERLFKEGADSLYLRRFYTAQFQSGFARLDYMDSAGVSVQVVTKCVAAVESDAESGRALLVAALLPLSGFRYRSPVVVAREPNLYTRADLWEVRAR